MANADTSRDHTPMSYRAVTGKTQRELAAAAGVRACVALILELSLSEVPHFVAMDDHRWSMLLDKWLQERGFGIVGVPDCFSGGCMAYGISIGVNTKDQSHAAVGGITPRKTVRNAGSLRCPKCPVLPRLRLGMTVPILIRYLRHSCQPRYKMSPAGATAEP